MTQETQDDTWFEKNTTITFKVTRRDFNEFTKLNFRKSDFFRFILKTVLTKDQECINRLDELLNIRVDQLALYHAERAKQAREWNKAHGY